MIKQFNELFESVDSNLDKGLKILNASASVEYYVINIPDLPISYNDTIFIYIPSLKRFGMCEKNDNMTKDEFVSLSMAIGHSGKLRNMPYINDPYFTTEDPTDILSMITLHKMDDKGLSDIAFSWLEEELMVKDIDWKTAVDNLLKEVQWKIKILRF